MKIHECSNCGGHSFLVSVPTVMDWKVNATGDYTDRLDCSERPPHTPSDEDDWICLQCGKRHKGKNLLVEGVKTITFTDLDDEVCVHAVIVKEKDGCITIKPYMVNTAYRDTSPLPSAYNEQTFNVWFTKDDVLYVKDEDCKSHLWAGVERSFLSETVVKKIRQKELKELRLLTTLVGKNSRSRSKGD